MTKSGREIVEIFEAFDLTGTAWSAAQLAGCDAKTVARYVAVREAGGDPLARTARPRLIDGFMPKVEELVDRSKGKIRADVAHRKLAAMGYRGSERSTRRAVAEVKQAWQAGRRRRYRPWVPEPGMWLQWDWGEGPRVRGRRTQLFAAWLAWSRFRVVIPAWDQQLGHADLVHRPGAAGGRRGADLPADRQRADRHHGSRRGDPGAAPGDGRAGPALRLQGGDVRAVRPGVQGRGRGDGEDRQGRPGPLGREPAAGLRQLRRARGGLPPVLRPGQRPGPPGDRGRPGRRGWPPSGSGCTRCRTSPMLSRWARSGWSATTRRSGSGRSATPPRPATPAPGCGAGSPGRSW